MPRLVFALLVSAALSSINTASIAKDIPGAPKALIGTFADSREQCHSYSQNDIDVDARHFFKGENGKYYYSSCLGKLWCRAEVLSYKATPTGFVLDLNHLFTYGNFSQKLSVTGLGRGAFRFHFAGGEPFNAVRCSSKLFHRQD